MAKTKEQKREYHRKYMKEYRKNPEKHIKELNYTRNRELKYKYGITWEDYQRMAAEQGNRCAICNSYDPGTSSVYGVFQVDHCHVTGKIRGLLCFRCNAGLGMFQDNSEFLKIAVDYLNKGN